MARQTGDILFVGTRQDGNGYITREGGAYFHLKPGPDRKAVRTKAVFARTRAAAGEFGKAADALGRMWRLVPKRMRLLAGEHGWQEAVSRVRNLESWNLKSGNLESWNIESGIGSLGRMGGFGVSSDAVDLGLDLELEGPSRTSGTSGASGSAKDGGRTLHDFASTGGAWPSAVRVWGLKEGLADLVKGGPDWRSFDGLPVAGHHVTGGMGAAKSKQRRRVVAKYWNAGNALEDRREMELEKWDVVARGKGYKDAAGWFSAMRDGLSVRGSTSVEGQESVSSSVESQRVALVKVHVAVVNVDGAEPLWYSEGEWVGVRELHRVRIPDLGAGMVFLGLEFGYLQSGVLLPLACLNRMWCLGHWSNDEVGEKASAVERGSVRRVGRRKRPVRGSVRGQRRAWHVVPGVVFEGFAHESGDSADVCMLGPPLRAGP